MDTLVSPKYVHVMLDWFEFFITPIPLLLLAVTLDSFVGLHLLTHSPDSPFNNDSCLLFLLCYNLVSFLWLFTHTHPPDSPFNNDSRSLFLLCYNLVSFLWFLFTHTHPPDSPVNPCSCIPVLADLVRLVLSVILDPFCGYDLLAHSPAPYTSR